MDLTPFTKIGKPAGQKRNADGTYNLYAVRWDVDCSRLGMQGFDSVTRRFSTANEAIAAVALGMGKAFCATAFDADSKQIASRRNPRHRRNRTASQMVAA